MINFLEVNVKEYVEMGLKIDTLVPQKAEKFARVIARQGELGEQVETYSNGNLETTNKVELDSETNLPDWILTKVENGKVALDKEGYKNEWIVSSKNFEKKYEIDPENADLFRPKGGVQVFVQIPNSISFKAPWGETMNIVAGGYLNITNLDDIYGIQEKDFHDTYNLVTETKNHTL